MGGARVLSASYFQIASEAFSVLHTTVLRFTPLPSLTHPVALLAQRRHLVRHKVLPGMRRIPCISYASVLSPCFLWFLPLLSSDETEGIYNRDKQTTLLGHFASTMKTVRTVARMYTQMGGCSNGGADYATLPDS